MNVDIDFFGQSPVESNARTCFVYCEIFSLSYQNFRNIGFIGRYFGNYLVYAERSFFFEITAQLVCNGSVFVGIAAGAFHVNDEVSAVRAKFDLNPARLAKFDRAVGGNRCRVAFQNGNRRFFKRCRGRI